VKTGTVYAARPNRSSERKPVLTAVRGLTDAMREDDPDVTVSVKVIL
jgi:hypothetical protein